MFRSSMLVVVAAAVSQTLSHASVAEAGGYRPGVAHLGAAYVAVPSIVLPHINLPGTVGLPAHGLHGSVQHLPSPAPHFVDGRFQHIETYNTWRNNRSLLGNPVGVETSVFSSRTQGTWMRFEHGFIVRYAAGNLAGRTYLVRGGIGQAWLDAGGAYGRLGFPKGNEFEFNSQGYDAQVFERGLIYWNATLGRFVVGPNGPKA